MTWPKSMLSKRIGRNKSRKWSKWKLRYRCWISKRCKMSKSVLSFVKISNEFNIWIPFSPQCELILINIFLPSFWPFCWPPHFRRPIRPKQPIRPAIRKFLFFRKIEKGKVNLCQTGQLDSQILGQFESFPFLFAFLFQHHFDHFLGQPFHQIFL